MSTFSGRAVFAASSVALVLVGGACAKRPFVPIASAPAPTPPPASAPLITPVATPEPATVVTPPPVAPPPAVPTARPSPPPKEFGANTALKTIHFDFDKSEIRSGDATTLEASAAWLKDNPNVLLLIEGHCDERGTEEYNLALGDRRARATMNYLMAQGVRGDRISMISYGEQRPVCTDHNETCWAQNRRAEFLVKERP